MATMEMKGMDSLVGMFHQMSPRVTDYLANEMMDLAEEVFNESQVQVPVRYGILKGSGQVSSSELDADSRILISISYGGAATEYALFVHENLSAVHAAPTKAKYLEDPMNTALDRLVQRMQGRVEGAIMGQYPQAPARAVTAEGRTNISNATRGSSRARLAAHIAKATPMTPAQVSAALRKMSGRGRSGR